MPDTYKFAGADGAEHTFVGDRPPTPDEIQQLTGGAKASPSVVSPDEPGTFRGGFVNSLGETAKKTGSGILEGLNPIEAVKGLGQTIAHPLTAIRGIGSSLAHPVDTATALSDPETGGKAIGNLVLAGVAGRLMPRVPDAMVGGGKALERAGELSKPVSIPLAVGEAAARGDFKGAAMVAGAPYAAKGVGFLMRRAGEAMGGGAAPTEAAAASSAVPASAAPQSLEDMMRARGLDPSKVISVTPKSGAPRIGPLARISERPPITVSPQSPMQPLAPVTAAPSLRDRELLAALGGRQASPLEQPRVDIGAEKVGRQQGLSPTAVRQQTGPILNEATGEASPVFPQKPFERMHDTLRAMGPGNPSRLDYVKAAGDPKTAGLLEIMRRTLERNGLSIAGGTLAGGTMAEAMRRALIGPVDGEQPEP